MDNAEQQPTDEQPQKLDLSAFYGDESEQTVVTESETEDLPDEDETEDEQTPEAEDQSDTSDDDEEETEDDTIEVFELNGKEYTVERIEELEKGELRQKDYTKKTQVAAEKTKQAEQIIEQFGRSVDEIEAIKSELQTDVASLEKQLTEELLEDDITEYTKLERRIAKEKQKLDKAVEKLAQAKQQQDLMDRQEKGKLLRELVPEFNDEKKAQVLLDDLEKLFNDMEIPIAEADKERSPYFWKVSKELAKLRKETAKNKRVTKTSKVSKSVKKKSQKPGKKSMVDAFYGS